MADVGIDNRRDPLPFPGIAADPPDEPWTHRPPYQPRTPEDFGPVHWRAHCQCGRISYALRRAQPLNAKYCHCRGCQVMHGAPFQWAAIFHKEDVCFAEGARGLSFYAAGSSSRAYELPTKVACSFCRTPIMDEGRNVCLLFPELIDPAGSDDDEHRRTMEAFQPSCHIFYAQRIINLCDGLPKWAGMDGRSELLDDHGHRIPRET